MLNTMLSLDEVGALASTHYALGDITQLKIIRRGMNDSYHLEAGGNQYVFRVYLNHKYFIESHDDYLFELEFLDHLHASNIPVIAAIRTKNDKLLEYVDTDLGRRAFALFPWAKGESLTRETATPEAFSVLGDTMARMHMAADSFKSTLPRYRLDFKYLADEPIEIMTDTKLKHGDDPAFKETLEEIDDLRAEIEAVDELKASVNQIGNNNHEFGLIHADLHPGNCHFDGLEVSVFDFDHCAFGWRAYDIALYQSLPTEFYDAFLQSYTDVRPLSDAELNALPAFLKLRQLWDLGDIIATEAMREAPKAF